MKTNVHFYNVKYEFTENITEAYVEACVNINKIKYLFPKDRGIQVRLKNIFKQYGEYYDGYVYIKANGMAALHIDDKYNRKRGMHIAYTKAQKQIFNNAANLYRDITNVYLEVMDRLYINTVSAALSCEDHIIELSK